MNFEIDPNRDYVGEMRRRVDELAEGKYYPPLVAHKIVNDLRTEDPDLLSGWLLLQAETMVRQSINDRDRSLRSSARLRPQSVFAEDVQHAERTGDTSRLERWLHAPFSLSTGARVALGDMSHDELVDVGQRYQTRANTDAMTASFLTALARAVGDGKVRDKFSEQDLATLWNSLGG